MSNNPRVPAAGSRSAAATAAALEAFDDEEDYESPPQPLPDVLPATPISSRGAAGSLGEGAARGAPLSPFQDALQKATKAVKIKVNGVGITIPAIDHHVADRSICCILKDEGWDCELPITDDVVVILNEKTYKAAYLGGFHRFPQLGIQTLYFPLPGRHTESELDAAAPAP